jgi:ligand-binding sensor domain-containing protein
VLLGKINADSFDGKYFAPKSIELDNDGMLWIKSYDQIFVVNPKPIVVNGKV